MSDNNGRFVWYELMVEDQPKAKTFYGKVLNWGFEDMPMPGVEGATYTLAKVDGAPVAGIMFLPDEAKAMGAVPSWAGHVGSPDVDATAAKAKALGGRVYREPTDIPGIGRFAVLSDPQGAVMMTFKGMGDPMPGPAPDATGTIGWRELCAANMEEVRDFYFQLFGWGPGEEYDMGPMGKYQLFKVGDDLTGGMMTKSPEMPAPFWGYYFNVEGIEAALARVTEAGGKVLMGPTQVPTGQFVGLVFDDQGVYFGLLSANK